MLRAQEPDPEQHIPVAFDQNAQRLLERRRLAAQLLGAAVDDPEQLEIACARSSAIVLLGCEEKILARHELTSGSTSSSGREAPPSFLARRFAEVKRVAGFGVREPPTTRRWRRAVPHVPMSTG